MTNKSKLATIILKAGKEEALLRFHPWIFSGAIAEAKGHPQEGDVVEVKSFEGKFLGKGHCAIGSIAVRMLTFEDIPIDTAFWTNSLTKAMEMRRSIGLPSASTNCYRLVHGEGDHLPGLIIDIYGSTAVMQAHSAGMYLARNDIANALQKVFGDSLQAIYDKSSQTVPHKAFEGVKDEFLLGNVGKDVVCENSLKFQVDWELGQKTGFFLDQRDNRSLLKSFCSGKKVLNTFCYTGGFSVYALKGGAIQVDSVDASAKAMQCCDENVTQNFGSKIRARHRSFTTDAFKFLQQNETVYDVIILDPPAFAKHGDALKNALQGYKRLNAQAIKQIAPGGILFTFSCSQAVNKDQFRNAVFTAAAMSGRKVRILHQLHQPADHPINIYHPEGEYLKGLVLLVE